MHVLALTDYLGNVGGAELSARTIVTELADSDAVDRVTDAGVDLGGVERLSFPGVEVAPVSLPGGADRLPDLAADRLVARLLARRAREVDADVVHAHHRRSAFALRHLEAVPTAATVRDYWPVCPISVYSVDCEQCTGCGDRLDDCVAHQGWDGPAEPAVKAYLLAKRRGNRAVLDHADAAVFIADHLRESVGASLSLPPLTPTIYNPVSVPLDGGAEPPDEPTLVTASSLTREKGVGTAVRAVGTLRETYPDLRLVVLGDGPLEGELRGLADSVAPGAVEFRGRVAPEAVYEAMAGATATVVPSLWAEPFGRVTVESQLLGTPVVGSRVGGIAEVVEDGETGLLYPAGDADALADRLEELLADPEAARRLGAAGRAAAAAFAPASVAERHVDFYRRLVS
jgi:glycosyltransferase involved in cell wall biosynthesis